MPEAKKATISVIMAVYNGAKYLCATLESILAQTFEDYEFIIVNDGSTDDTKKIIEKYPDDRLLLINNPRNIGQTASLNVALYHATGEYIARTDAGDVSAPGRFRKQVQFLEKHPNIDILGTAAFQYDVAGNFCGSVFMPTHPRTILQRIFFACPVVHVSVMMRRERILHLNGYDESHKVLADYGLWAKALRHGFRFWNLSEVLAGYLVTPDSFGSAHGRGRSVHEASRIISEIALAMIGERVSTDQAEDIYRFFVFGPQDLNMEKMNKTEALFEKLLLRMNMPQRDINYLLLRSYIKMLTGKRAHDFFQKYGQKFILRRIIFRYGGIFSSHIFEDLRRCIQSSRYRIFSGMEKRIMPSNTISPKKD